MYWLCDEKESPAVAIVLNLKLRKARHEDESLTFQCKYFVIKLLKWDKIR